MTVANNILDESGYNKIVLGRCDNDAEYDYRGVMYLGKRYLSMHVNAAGDKRISLFFSSSDLRDTSESVARVFAIEKARQEGIFYNSGLQEYAKPVVTVITENGVLYPAVLHPDKVQVIKTGCEECFFLKKKQTRDEQIKKALAIAEQKDYIFHSSIGQYFSQMSGYTTVVRLASHFVAMHVFDKKAAFISKQFEKEITLAEAVANAFAKENRLVYSLAVMKFSDSIMTIVRKGPIWHLAAMNEREVTVVGDLSCLSMSYCSPAIGFSSLQAAEYAAQVTAYIHDYFFMPAIENPLDLHEKTRSEV